VDQAPGEPAEHENPDRYERYAYYYTYDRSGERNEAHSLHESIGEIHLGGRVHQLYQLSEILSIMAGSTP